MKLSKRPRLDFEVGELPEPRDHSADRAIGERFSRNALAHNLEIDEKIAKGWGGTDPKRIPNNWRTRPGPDMAERLAMAVRNNGLGVIGMSAVCTLCRIAVDPAKVRFAEIAIPRWRTFTTRDCEFVLKLPICDTCIDKYVLMYEEEYRKSKGEG